MCTMCYAVSYVLVLGGDYALIFVCLGNDICVYEDIVRYLCMYHCVWQNRQVCLYTFRYAWVLCYYVCGLCLCVPIYISYCCIQSVSYVGQGMAED